MHPTVDRDVFVSVVLLFGFVILFFVFPAIRSRPEANQAEANSQDPVNSLNAESRAPRPRWNEPDSFAGLRFGEDLTKQISQCPEYVSVTGYKKSCYEKHTYEPGVFALYNVVDLPAVSEIRAIQLNQKLAGVTLLFRSGEAEELLLALKQRYGTPTKTITQQQSRFEMATGYEASWIGNQVSIVFQERGGFKVNQGLVEYQTKNWIEHQQAETVER